MDTPEISVVVLAYRSAETIKSFVDSLVESLENENLQWESVLVGNYFEGKGDQTPEVINKIASQNAQIKVVTEIKKGMIYAAQFENEIEVAKKALKILNVDNWTARFASSVTEINQLLIRLIRGYTNRQLFIKFEGHYHGWMDSINYSVHPDLEYAGDEISHIPVPESTGMDILSSKSIIIARWNDIEHLNKIFEKYSDNIAGVIMEPILANTNCIIPNKSYLESVKRLCHKNGSLLAFDEVMTGF